MSQRTVVEGVRGSGLTVMGSAATLILQFASVAILSRMLRPEDFGLVAMVGVFITLGNLIRDFGMPTAAIQARTLSHQQASNLFWVNVALAGSAATLLTLATPLLVLLYSESRLAAVVPAMALVVLINGVGAQIQIDLARRMRFRALAVSDVSAQVLALAVAIGLAYWGAGYWALVAQGLIAALVTLAARWTASRWRPARFRRGHGSMPLFRTGAEFGLAYLLTFVQSNADTLIIGATLGPSQLGLYNRAYQILTAPAARLLDPLTQVVVPGINRARSEGATHEPLLLRIQYAVGCGAVWLFAMAGGTALRVVPIVLGPGWDRTTAVFQILAIGGCVWVFSHVSYWIFILNEQSRELLRYNLLTKPIALLCLAVGSLQGIEGVAWGYVVAMTISWPVNLIWLARTTGLHSWDFARNGVTILLAGAVGGLLALLVTMNTAGATALLSIPAASVAGTAAMLIVLLMFPRSRRQLASSFSLLKLTAGAVGPR